jgi:hypothetical protein
MKQHNNGDLGAHSQRPPSIQEDREQSLAVPQVRRRPPPPGRQFTWAI